ncbi:MAG: M10 family metallopeptidase C-terminal domain-containing protein [Gemmobacter sp.]
MTSVTSTSLVTQDAALANVRGLMAAPPDLTEGADAAAGTGTAYTLRVGEDFAGRLSSGTDADWIAVDLVAGSRYVFTAHGTGGQTAGIDDTILRLMNAGGQQVAINEDIASSQGNDFSAIRFTATTTGRYFLNVQAFGGETGTYAVQAATNVFTLDQVVTQITQVNWGRPVEIAFPTAPGGTITVNIAGLTADGQRLAQAAMDAWEYASGINFVTATGAGADIVIDDARAGALGGPSAFYPDTGEIVSSAVNIGSDWISTYGRALNTHTFTTYIHEIGHALGLAHPGSYNGGASYATDALFANDSTQMTVMSYFDAVQNTFIEGTDWIPVTAMIADIAAMQSLYGMPTTVNVGDTVWGVASNVGGTLGRIFSYAFDLVTPDANWWSTGAQSRGIGFTIYDQGGTDLFDVSTYTGGQVIDLRSEGVSSVLGEVGNVVIMRGSVIEHARTGQGNDRITGNAAANRIDAGYGDDTVDGGDGTDTAVLAVSRFSVTATVVGGSIRIQSALGVDVFSNIEFFEFADQTVTAESLMADQPLVLNGTVLADSMAGTDAAERIVAAGGNDTVSAGLGNDSVYGGTGNDVLNGESGADVLYGDAGDDTLFGDIGNDTLQGEDGEDRMNGGEGNDSLDGGLGNDILEGGNRNDTLVGGDGDDVLGGGTGIDSIEGNDGNDDLIGSYGNDLMFGGADNDSLNGGEGRDLIFGGTGHDILGGGLNADTLYGEEGNDFLTGGAASDTLYGETGMDSLTGGEGSDQLWGGLDADLFVFNLVLVPRGGTDEIRDFEDGADRIRIVGVTGTGAAGKFDALNITESGGNTTIAYGQQVIVLTGVAMSMLDSSDFLLS